MKGNSICLVIFREAAFGASRYCKGGELIPELRPDQMDAGVSRYDL